MESFCRKLYSNSTEQANTTDVEKCAGNAKSEATTNNTVTSSDNSPNKTTFDNQQEKLLENGSRVTTDSFFSVHYNFNFEIDLKLFTSTEQFLFYLR